VRAGCTKREGGLKSPKGLCGETGNRVLCAAPIACGRASLARMLRVGCPCPWRRAGTWRDGRRHPEVRGIGVRGPVRSQWYRSTV
jgi:hypothetical protein